MHACARLFVCTWRPAVNFGVSSSIAFQGVGSLQNPNHHRAEGRGQRAEGRGWSRWTARAEGRVREVTELVG